MKNKIINLYSKQVLLQMKGVKYSELLEQFINAFINDFKDIVFFEEIIEFSIYAWNTGNMKTLLSDDEVEKTFSEIDTDEIDFDLFRKMIDYKLTHFKDYSNFITDYRFKETKGNPILSVITQTQEAYFEKMFNNEDEEELQLTPDDFEENYINRTALIVKPKQPFLDWCVNIYPEDVDKINDILETRTYLIHEYIENVEEWLKKKYDNIFKLELDSYHTNKKNWPKKRNYKMFKEWFHIDISTMVFDFENEPVLKFQ